MESEPSRPGFIRFSLRTLFVVLTAAAVLSLTLAWYLQRPKFEVYGDLSQSDLAAICEVIARTSQMSEKRILLIRVNSPNEVEVETGVVHGPLDGGGQEATLQKKNGIWTIISVNHWVS